MNCIGWANDVHMAAMVFDNAIHHGQAQTCPFTGFFGGKERFENPFYQFWRDTMPLVGNRNCYRILIFVTFKHNTPLLWAGIPCVRQKIYKNLNNALCVTSNNGGFG